MGVEEDAGPVAVALEHAEHERRACGPRRRSARRSCRARAGARSSTGGRWSPRPPRCGCETISVQQLLAAARRSTAADRCVWVLIGVVVSFGFGQQRGCSRRLMPPSTGMRRSGDPARGRRGEEGHDVGDVVARARCRPSGMRSRNAVARPPGRSSVGAISGVRTTPGATDVAADAARARARARRSATSASTPGLRRRSSGRGRRPAISESTDEMITIEPPSVRCGAAACSTLKAPVRLTAISEVPALGRDLQ